MTIQRCRTIIEKMKYWENHIDKKVLLDDLLETLDQIEKLIVYPPEKIHNIINKFSAEYVRIRHSKNIDEIKMAVERMKEVFDE